MKLLCCVCAMIIAFSLCSGYGYSKEAEQEQSQAEVVQGEQKEQKEELPPDPVRDRQDAISRAKEYLKKEKLQDGYHLTRYLVALEDGVWHVVFLKKREEKSSDIKSSSIRVTIEEATGKVLKHADQEGFSVKKR